MGFSFNPSGTVRQACTTEAQRVAFFSARGEVAQSPPPSSLERKTRPPFYIGSWNERFSYAVDDVRAWLNYAERQGYEHVVLAGHSLGANKVIRYLSAVGNGISHIHEITSCAKIVDELKKNWKG